ncbi:MAG: DUF6588 family protein, partial [Saprospiraceae bacterium]
MGYLPKNFKVLAYFIILVSSPLYHTNAQSFEDLINSYIDNNASGYLRPIADLATANMCTGIREWSKIDTHFYIRVGVVGSYSFPSQKMKSFSGKTGLGFEPEQEVKVPTIIGANEAIAVEGVNGTYFVFPVGYAVKALPFIIPQISIGGIYHTELTGRFFAIDLKNDYGKIQTFGIGFKHELNGYFPRLPFDLAVGYFYQQFKLGSYMSTNNQLVSIHIGKSGRRCSSHIVLGYIS